MHITLSPVRMDETLELERQGDVLTFNGQAVDLSGVAEGAPLPAAATGCAWITGAVERIDKRLHLTVILPHGPNAPQATLFPEPLRITRNGRVRLPAHDQPEA